MRKCKCQITGEWGTISTFYRVTDEKGVNKYYKNKEIYDEFTEEKRKKSLLMQYIKVNILGYEEKQFVPPFLIKRINELLRVYPIEVVFKTFHTNLENIQYWMSRDDKFKNEQAKMSYMMAIIKNAINEVYKEWKEKERRNISIGQSNIDFDIINSTLKSKNNKVVDISDFL